MRSRTTKEFHEALAKLPPNIRKRAHEAYAKFKADPYQNGLEFKKVNSAPLTYSARVTLGYRAVGYRAGNTIIWFWIGSHAQYDEVLKHL